MSNEPLITPPVRAQWEEREPTDPYFWVPHEMSLYTEGEDGWRLAGASVRGRDHAHKGTYREDSFQLATIGTWNIIAVSDGAGSRKFSRVGSKIATGAAVEEIKNYWKEAIQPAQLNLEQMQQGLTNALRAAFQGAYHYMEKYPTLEGGRDSEMKFEDLGCTLLLAIHTSWEDKHLLATLQVGDGAMFILRDPQNPQDMLEVGDPDVGPDGSETWFVTSRTLDDWLRLKSPRLFVEENLWLFLSMTDGIADDLLPYSQYVPSILLNNGILKTGLLEIEPLEEVTPIMTQMIKYEKKASFDDRTLAMLFKYQPPNLDPHATLLPSAHSAGHISEGESTLKFPPDLPELDNYAQKGKS